MRAFLTLVGAVLIALLELPAMRRQRMFGEFWAVAAILGCSAIFGILMATEIKTRSVVGLIIEIVRPFGEMMVGP